VSRPADPSAGLPNPKPRRPEIVVPAWEEMLAIADEIDTRYAVVAVLVAGTGLRVEEGIRLEQGSWSAQ
jgi:hypothetical protein